eukprot:11890516-Alexandrium_andersonii.AAC.1
MRTRNIHILAIQETNVALSTQYVMGDYTFLLFGGGGDREYAGMDFIILSRLVKATLGVQDHGPREAWLALRASPGNLHVASCYAPQSGRPLEEREHFF